MNDGAWILLSLSLSGGLLFLVTLGISRLLTNRFSKTWHYYIWLLVLLRFLVPVAPEASLMGTVFRAVPPAPAGYVTTQTANTGANGNAATENPAGQPATDEDHPAGISLAAVYAAVRPWLWVPWLGVALALLIRKITLYQSFAAYIRAGNAEVSDPAVLNRLAEVCETLHIDRPIDLYENPLTATPLILGFFRPSIVLPSVSIEDADFRYIMLHELTHYRRRDLFYKWLVQIVLCLHWFNPLVYRLSKEINTACELSCDETVIRSLDGESQKAYGNVLIESLKNPGKYKQALAGVTLSENAQSVKERLQAIMKYQKKSAKTVVLSLLTALFLLTCGVAMGTVTPGMLAAQSTPPEISLEGKPEAYKLVAKMTEVDQSLSVADYTRALLEICEEAGAEFFETVADSGIIEPTDPLYTYSTGTLARTSSEIYATHFPDTERPMVFAHALWERYATEEEKAAEQGDWSDEEWQAFLEATRDDPEYPVSMKYVSYVIFYSLTDPEHLTVQERDELLDTVRSDMQSYLDGMTEEEVFSDDFQSNFTRELRRVTELYATEGMTLEGEVSSDEGYRDGEPMF